MRPCRSLLPLSLLTSLHILEGLRSSGQTGAILGSFFHVSLLWLYYFSLFCICQNLPPFLICPIIISMNLCSNHYCLQSLHSQAIPSYSFFGRWPGRLSMRPVSWPRQLARLVCCLASYCLLHTLVPSRSILHGLDTLLVFFH